MQSIFKNKNNRILNSCISQLLKIPVCNCTRSLILLQGSEENKILLLVLPKARRLFTSSRVGYCVEGLEDATNLLTNLPHRVVARIIIGVIIRGRTVVPQGCHMPLCSSTSYLEKVFLFPTN